MPDKIKGSDVIDPLKLSIEEKKSFVDSLYQLHSRIFDGVDRESFVSYVIDSPADLTRIRIYKNHMDEWIGYCAVHRFNKRVFTRPFVIFRAEAGLLREYRGQNQTLWFGFSETIKYRIKHPFCSLYYLGSFVHPTIFYIFSQYFNEFYPRADAPMPEKIKKFMLELAKIFHIEPVEGQDVLVRQVGWITKDSTEDRIFWQNHTHPVVKFYIKNNPGYMSGNGLLTLIPLTFENIFMSLVRFMKNKLVRERTRLEEVWPLHR